MSSAYVERRESALAGHKALDGAGKRAAFALYYGPIHYLLIRHIARELGLVPAPGVLIDLGCGTGVGGAAVATAAEGVAVRGLDVLGVDTHPWALDEARFTYRAFGLTADVRRGHAARTRFPAHASTIVMAFVVNELKDPDRATLLREILRWKADTTRRRAVLVVEPISLRVSPWWNEWATAFASIGGRSDEWRVRADLPPLVKQLAKASGLRPDVLTARSLAAE